MSPSVGPGSGRGRASHVIPLWLPASGTLADVYVKAFSGQLLVLDVRMVAPAQESFYPVRFGEFVPPDAPAPFDLAVVMLQRRDRRGEEAAGDEEDAAPSGREQIPVVVPRPEPGVNPQPVHRLPLGGVERNA